MFLTRKVIVLPFMLFCLQTFAVELSMDLQKACANEQLIQHKGIKGRALEANDFNEYCKCEADYILKKATKEQLNLISKDQTIKPKWLQQIKSNALKSCIEPENKRKSLLEKISITKMIAKVQFTKLFQQGIYVRSF